MNSLLALFTAFVLWFSPAESDSRFTKYKLSSSSSTFTTTSTSFVDVTNLSLSFKTTGRPVIVGLVADGSSGASQSYIGGSATAVTTAGVRLKILRDAVVVAEVEQQVAAALNAAPYLWTYSPPSSLWGIDVPSAGTYTYKVQALVINSSITGSVIRSKLAIYELP